MEAIPTMLDTMDMLDIDLVMDTGVERRGKLRPHLLLMLQLLLMLKLIPGDTTMEAIPTIVAMLVDIMVMDMVMVITGVESKLRRSQDCINCTNLNTHHSQTWKLKSAIFISYE